MSTDLQPLTAAAPPQRLSEGDVLTAPVRLLIGICALVYFLDGLVHSILGPLAPAIARSLHLSNTELGPIFAANLVGQCLGLIVLPIFAGRVGERMIVLISLVGFGLAQSGTALADGALSLFVWRLVTGVFLGGCLPSCLALVTAAAPEKRRGLAIMMLFTGYGLGATVAGFVANAFTDLGGWRGATVVVGAVCLVVAVFAWIGLAVPAASDRGRSAAPPRSAAQGQSAAHAQTAAQAQSAASAQSAAPARSAAPANSTAHRPNTLLIFSPRYLLGTLMLWVLFIAMLTISYCLNSWLPILLVEVGRDERLAAVSVSIFSLGGIVAALGVGLLIDRLGAMRTLIFFLSLASVLLLSIGQVLASAPGWLLLVLLAVCGFFVLGAYGGVNVVLASFYPAPLRAAGIGWTKSVGRVGTLMAPVLIGAGLSTGVAQSAIMSLFAVPALLAVVALVVIARSEARVREG